MSHAESSHGHGGAEGGGKNILGVVFAPIAKPENYVKAAEQPIGKVVEIFDKAFSGEGHGKSSAKAAGGGEHH